jgi:hypothetical protein
MADRDKDRDKDPTYDTELPGDEEFAEEPEETTEGERKFIDDEADGEYEGEDAENEALAASAASDAHRRFGFRFGGGRHAEEEADRRQIGSVRESHERVHIDDRPSAIYALLCAGALLGVLAFSWVGGVLPKSVGPTLTPLVVPTSQATVSSSASASLAPSVSASASVGASASAAPSLSPTP